MSIHDEDIRLQVALPFVESRPEVISLPHPRSGTHEGRNWDDYGGETPEPVSTLKFFLKYLKNPTTVGALFPSGQNLAALITSEISPDMGPVLELGAGNGIFTSAILDRGVAPHDIVAVELEPSFASRLARRFPGITVVNAAAEDALCADGAAHFGAAVSGLPLLNFPWSVRQRLLHLIFEKLRPGAALYQFTYGLSAPIPKSMLRSVGLREEFLGRVYRNVPPAGVYKISRL